MGGSQHGRLTPVEEEDFKACVGNDNFKLVCVAESSLVRAERMMHMMQTSCIAQKVPKGHVSDRAVERFGRYFLRLAPLGGALDKDAVNGGLAGLFPRGGPNVFSFALLANPRDHLGSGGKHVALSSRFHLEIDALEGGF